MSLRGGCLKPVLDKDVSGLREEEGAEGHRNNGIGARKELQVAVDSVLEVHQGAGKVDVTEDGCLVDRVWVDVCWD